MSDRTWAPSNKAIQSAFKAGLLRRNHSWAADLERTSDVQTVRAPEPGTIVVATDISKEKKIELREGESGDLVPDAQVIS